MPVTAQAALLQWLDLRKTFDALDSSRAKGSEKIDLIALGNPHLSLTECEMLDELVKKENMHAANTRIMACMSRALYSKAKDLGYVPRLEEFGVEFVNDTCWCMLLDGPIIPSNPNAVIMTNSGKYAHYGPGLTDRRFRFGSLADCLMAAATGRYPQRGHRSDCTYPTWLSFHENGRMGWNSQRRNYSTYHQNTLSSRVFRLRSHHRAALALLRLAIIR